MAIQNPGENEILIHGENTTEMISQDDYQNSSTRDVGFGQGIADSKYFNKLLRQLSRFCKSFAKVVSDNSSYGIKDNGEIDANAESILIGLKEGLGINSLNTEITGIANDIAIAETNANNYTDSEITKVNNIVAEKETPAGAQSKSDTAEQNAKDYADLEKVAKTEFNEYKNEVSTGMDNLANKPTSATEGNLAIFDANRNPVDSGKNINTVWKKISEKTLTTDTLQYDLIIDSSKYDELFIKIDNLLLSNISAALSLRMNDNDNDRSHSFDFIYRNTANSSAVITSSYINSTVQLISTGISQRKASVKIKISGLKNNSTLLGEYSAGGYLIQPTFKGVFSYIDESAINKITLFTNSSYLIKAGTKIELWGR